MSSPNAAASLVRVSVSSGTRRADLGVPGGIPVVEIVPELARELGVLDADSATKGFRLVSGSGSVLDPDRSFAAQGVTDGAVLSLDEVDPGADRVYDDVVEAVADVVETQFPPWTAQHSANTAVSTAVVLFLCAAYALFTTRSEGPLVVAVSAAVALVLVGTAAVLHTRGQPVGALAMGGTALVFAAVAGSAVRPSVPLWGEGLMYVGAAVALVGLLGAAVVGRHRLVLAAGSVVGAVMVALGALAGPLGVSMTTACTGVFVAATIVGSLLPWLGISSSRLTTRAPRTDAEISADVPDVDRSEVRAQVARGHDVMVAVSLATGLSALAVTPQLVASGLSGALLVVAGYAATLLRTRHTRTRTTVLLAMTTGIVGLAIAAIAAAQWHPGWRPTLAVVLGLGAALVVGLAVVAPRTRVGLGRVADTSEGIVLVALLPLAAATVGVL